MTAPKRTRSRGAFTLVELIISAALMSIVLGAGYACLRAGVEARELLQARGEAAQKARVALELMCADLRAACPLSRDLEFLGMQRWIGAARADNLDFGTHHYTPQAEREGDFCETSYFLELNPETGWLELWRRRDASPDEEPLGGGRRELIIDGVAELQYEYYDGFEWFDEWGDPLGHRPDPEALWQDTNLAGLPEAVRITLSFPADPARRKQANDGEEDSPPAELVFQSVARLTLAPLIRAATGALGGETSGQGADRPDANGSAGGRP